MMGFGPERSKACWETGAPQSGHGRPERSGSGSVSYGPTVAGPATRTRFVFSHAYLPPASLTRSRSGRSSLFFRATIISVLINTG